MDESLQRGKAELHDLVGDASKARERLGWSPTIDFEASSSSSSTLTSSACARSSSPPRPSPTADVSVSARARRLAAPVGRPLRRAPSALRTRDWPPHSRLFVEQEAAEWVLAYEARQLERTARALGVELGPRLGQA